jgi:hypothetical protein
MTWDYDGVWRVHVNGPQLYAVGEFNKVHNVSQQKLARFTDTNSGPAVSLTPVSWNFGNQAVGVASASRTITLHNTGNAPLNIASITADPAEYSQSNTCGSSVAVGGSCDIDVVFTPSTNGVRPGTITIRDNDSSSSQTVYLTGNGTK